MRIQLSDHFTYKRLLQFVFPSIVMMLCTSVYSIVDGLFVSNFVGKTPFAAVNIVFPFLMAMGAIGFMVGTGGSAIISRTLGEGKKDQANQYFSMLIYVTIGVSLLLSVAGVVFMRPIAGLLGAEGELADDCVIYGRILLAFQTAFILQNVFQSFFVVAEKPGLSLRVSIAAGLTNFVLDFLFIAVFDWGLAGAAFATVCGQMVGGILPLVYFTRKNDSLLRLVKTGIEGRIIVRTCTNGVSEMLTSLSASFVNILYNFQLMRFAGEDGVAAYGAIMYVNFIFAAIFIGYSIGCGPVIGYHFGAGNRDELSNLFRKSLRIIGTAGVTLTLLAEFLSSPLTRLFVGYDQALYEMTCHGFRMYALAFLINGFNAFGSAFFTALSNGLISAVISFMRTLIFETSAVLLLPVFLGLDGIWLAIVAAELSALLVTASFFAAQRKRYGY
ncbi:MAG: MATE family efflux transporter [Clostridium sp.]|jgi:putative MATE family efflux protein